MDKFTWKRALTSTKSHNQPVSRWGHNCCVIGEEVVFFGGYADSNYMNDVWSYNTVTMDWKQIIVKGDIPSNRSNCSMNYDSENNRIVVFGGGGPNKRRFNTINMLNWENKQWIQIAPKCINLLIAENQSSPWERTYHVSQLYYPYLIIHGGQSLADLDDLWIFNFLTLSWQQIITDKIKPCARRFHSSAIVKDQFFIIAGCHGKYRPLNDIYSLNIKPLKQGNLHLQWKQCKYKSTAFLTRWGQTSSVYDNKIYIFGGRFSSDLNDVVVVDVEKQTMKTLKTTPDMPKPRRRHSSCVVGSCLVIFGGFNGQYFNDLHYVNIFELRSKLTLPALPSIEEHYINQYQFSDHIIFSKHEQTVPLHKGLIINRFPNEDLMINFLNWINYKFTKAEILRILQILYKGFGTIDLKGHQLSTFKIKLWKNFQEKQIETRKCILKEQFLGKKTNNVIYMKEHIFNSYLDKARKSYKDLTFIINKKYSIPTNQILLILSSQYFANIVSQTYSDKKLDRTIDFSLQTHQIVLFEILIYYLQTDYLIIPEEFTIQQWMKLCNMSQLYCLQRLKILCQQQLCAKVSKDNFLVVMEFALIHQLQILALWCADIQIKLMVNQQVYHYSCTESVELRIKKQYVLKMVYQMLRFDILQTRLNSDTSYQKSSQFIEQEKQNYQISLE